MKKCKQGYYYCYKDKKCKKIPTGYRVGLGGYLRREHENEKNESEENGNHQNGNGNGNGNSNGGSNGGGVSEGTLHNWFKGSKSKSKNGKKAKPGWVNVLTGGTCASDEPGEGVPKCVSRSKYNSMTPAERRSSARRKKTEDSKQQEKSGAAKPTYVSTDNPKKKKKMKEELQVTEAKDKKSKGSGKKDACYNKVKANSDVWPSAYASGRLVQCRKKGAANWGNKSEEWVVNTAAEYFFNEGINEDGVEIFIEEIGLESFVEFVQDIAEFTYLTEARAAKRRTGGKTYAQVKAEIDAREAAKKKPSTEKTKSAADTAKNKQPKRRPVLDAIAKQVTAGMKRHRDAMNAARETGKTISKAAKVGAEGAKKFSTGVKSGVETAGKVAKVAKKAVSENVQYSDWRDDFKATEYEFIDIIKPEPLVSEASFEIGHTSADVRKAKTEKKIRDRTKTNDEGSDIAKKKLKGPSLPMEEVDTRRAPAELVARMSARREGKMAQDGPNKPAYDAKQRLLAKTKAKRMKEQVETVDEERPARRRKPNETYSQVDLNTTKKDFYKQAGNAKDKQTIKPGTVHEKERTANPTNKYFTHGSRGSSYRNTLARIYSHVELEGEQIDEIAPVVAGALKIGGRIAVNTAKKKVTQKIKDTVSNRMSTEEKEESKIDGGNLKKLVTKAVRRVDADVDGDVDTNDMKSSDTGEFVPSPDGKKLKPKVRFEGASDWRNELDEAIDKSNKVKW